MKKNVPLIPLSSIGASKKMRICVMTCILTLAIGTAMQAQPVTLKQLTSGSTNFTVSNGNLYYSKADSLFISNGTPGGTAFVKNTGETILRISKVSAGNTSFFITQTGSQESLWKTDGTAAGTVKVATYSSIQPMIAYQNELYLRINDGVHGYELWKLSSSGSLMMLKDINPGAGQGVNHDIVISNNVLFFIAGADPAQKDLWKTDGTSAGTVQAVDLPSVVSEFANSFYALTDVDGTMFMTRSYPGYDRQMAELWKTDGTQATTSAVKIFDDDAGSYNDLEFLTSFKGKLYFIRNYVLPFHDLMVSDGTEAGTQVIKQVSIDGQVYDMEKTNDHLALYSHTQGFANDIIKSDGTIAGTQSVHDMSGAHSYDFGNLTATPNLLFFVDDVRANPGDYNSVPGGHFQLWQADLHYGNPVTLKDLYNISLEGSDNVNAAGDKIFFTTSNEQGFRLWHYDPASTPICAGTGTILREVWRGVQGTSVSQIPINTGASRIDELNVFETPTNYGDHYGSRLRGYLCAPATGNYRFWIASNDNSELWLSTTTNAEDKVRIAFVNGFTNPRQYDKYPSQQSALISLVAGQLYYIEALHKEGVGTDHVSVGMQLPDGTLQRPIPGARLMPFEIPNNNNRAPFVHFRSPGWNQTFSAPATVNIRVDAVDRDGTITKVEFYKNGIKIGQDVTAPYTFTLTNLPAGSYTLGADAFDDDGAVGSDMVNITVQNSSMARTSETLMADDETKGNVNLSPNPARRGPLTVTFSDYDLNEKDNEVMVEVVSLMGKVMYSGPVSCPGKCENLQLDITDKFAPGVYVVNGVINKKRFSKRLIIQH